MQPYALTTEVFCFEHLGQHVAYAPLKRVLLVVNSAAANILAQLANGTFAGPDDQNLGVLSTLVDLGLVNGTPEEVHQDGNGQFRPTNTTLFLTSACNLRCVYCYASGGDKPRHMTWPVIKAAVDFVAENAKVIETGSFGLSFHGGGEPTIAWEMLTQATLYARQLAVDKGLKCQCALATNGVLSNAQAEWIAANIDDVNVSVDGLEEVHNQLRPLRAGGGSFAAVFRTIQLLSRAGRPFGLRMTIARDNVAQVPEAVRFFCQAASPRVIHLEPVFRCGRCAVEGVPSPSIEEFLSVFRVARDIADQRGIHLYYSGARFPNIATIFCQAAGMSFTVVADGNVTACYEVADSDDPRAATFFFGRYDDAAGAFVFDPDKLKNLARLTVDKIPFCRDCLCKYHCAGDCPAKRMAAFDDGLPVAASGRCRITQELTKDQIIRALHDGSQTMRIVSREHAIAGETQHG